LHFSDAPLYSFALDVRRVSDTSSTSLRSESLILPEELA